MKYVSWTCQSNGTTATIAPVIPPSTKITTKPTMNRIGVFIGGRRPHSEAIHAKICTALAIATIKLAAAKKCIDNAGNPVAYM